MRTFIFSLVLTLAMPGLLTSQNPCQTRIPMLGEQAPSFTAMSTMGKINFPDDYYTKWKIIFSHPADFTPVCSSELLELAALQEDFDKLGAKLVVISTDGLNSHISWVQSLDTLKYKDRNPEKINFPLVADENHAISRKYGMVGDTNSSTRDVRGVFIIDPDDKIAAIFFYPRQTGRNMDEIRRTLVALQTSANKNVLTPANWLPGQAVMIPAPQTTQEAEKLNRKNDPDLYSLTWYMWFKRKP
jgi:peroxiredoxin (alkyl hydroperoxide reductase subunit C)